MNLLYVPRCLLLASVAFFGLAHAAPVTNTWYQIDETNGDFSITYKGKTVNLSASPATYLIDDQQWFYDGNLNPQDPASIKADVETRYGLTSGSLTTVGYCPDNGCSNATMTSGTTTGGTPTSTFAVTPGKAFDYLAIHLGLGELFFHWSVATDTFTLAGKAVTSISNYRAYLGPQVVVTPLPGAALLFISGLGALGVIGRRRNRAQGPTPA